MLRESAIVSFVLLLSVWQAAPASAQAAPLTPGTRTISVSGHGDAKAKPDELAISFAVESTAASGDACTKLQSEKTAKIVDALKGKLAGKGEIVTSNFSLSAITESIPAGPAGLILKPSALGWQFSELIKADTDKLETVGTLIDAAMAAGATRVSQTTIEDAPVDTLTGRIELNSPYGQRYLGSTIGALSNTTSPSGKSKPRYEMKQVPSVTFEIQANGATAAEAVNQGAKLSHRVEQALRDKLGKTGALQVVTFHVYQVNPNQFYGMSRQFIAPRIVTKQSFVAHSSIRVKTDQMDLLGALLDVGVTAGAARVNSVTFTLSSDAAARTEAIAAASREALTKAQVVANSMGVKLGNLLSVSVNGALRPRVISGSRLGYSSSASFEDEQPARRITAMPRDVGFSADVNAVYEIQ